MTAGELRKLLEHCQDSTPVLLRRVTYLPEDKYQPEYEYIELVGDVEAFALTVEERGKYEFFDAP